METLIAEYCVAWAKPLVMKHGGNPRMEVHFSENHLEMDINGWFSSKPCLIIARGVYAVYVFFRAVLQRTGQAALRSEYDNCYYFTIVTKARSVHYVCPWSWLDQASWTIGLTMTNPASDWWINMSLDDLFVQFGDLYEFVKSPSLILHRPWKKYCPIVG